jgi:hypothetical protein
MKLLSITVWRRPETTGCACKANLYCLTTLFLNVVGKSVVQGKQRLCEGEEQLSLRRKVIAMCARPLLRQASVEECAGVLTDAAYPVVLRHGVKGSSVDVELDVWKAFRKELSRRPLTAAASADVDDCGSLVLEETSAQLTEAAYQVALRRGFSGSFIDVELDLWKALSKVN